MNYIFNLTPIQLGNLFLNITRPYIEWIYGIGYKYDSINKCNMIYYYKGVNRYCMILKNKRSKPSQIVKVLGHKPALYEVHRDPYDITERIKEYMGPSNDFHTLSVTPAMFGYIRIDFVDLDNNIISFDENEKIII